MEVYKKLKNGSWEARVLPEWGMNLLCLRYDNEEILRTPKDLNDLQRTPFLYGTPFLFPAGRVKGGKFPVGADVVQLPINEPARGNHLHGLMYRAPFLVSKLTENRICAQYRSQDKQLFPMDVLFEVEYTLEMNGIYLTYRFTNQDNLPVPISFALHTAFVTPKTVCVQVGKKWGLDDCCVATGMEEAKNEAEKSLSQGLVLDGEKLSGMFEMNGSARIGNVVYTADVPFDTWVVYNGDGKSGFLCVEPQCGIGIQVNEHDSKMLMPGNTMEFRCSITI